MSENGQEPEVVEYGRYRMYGSAEGLVLARAAGTCERCQECGCGDQQEPVLLPDPRWNRMRVMGWLAENVGKGPLGALGRMMSHE